MENVTLALNDTRIQQALTDLNSANTEKRIAAIKTLEQTQCADAVPELIEALCDEEADVRAAANSALQAIGGLAILPGLFNLLRNDDLKDKERVIQLGETTLRHFARDVHDGAAAKLAAAVMQVAIVGRLMELDPEQVPAEFRQLKALTGQASREVRNIIRNLKATSKHDDRRETSEISLSYLRDTEEGEEEGSK